MTVIVCLDNANGMMFNHRRQSRDANVVKDILKTINGASLLIAPWFYSLAFRFSSFLLDLDRLIHQNTGSGVLCFGGRI